MSIDTVHHNETDLLPEPGHRFSVITEPRAVEVGGFTVSTAIEQEQGERVYEKCNDFIASTTETFTTMGLFPSHTARDVLRRQGFGIIGYDFLAVLQDAQDAPPASCEDREIIGKRLASIVIECLERTKDIMILGTDGVTSMEPDPAIDSKALEGIKTTSIKLMFELYGDVGTDRAREALRKHIAELRRVAKEENQREFERIQHQDNAINSSLDNFVIYNTPNLPFSLSKWSIS